MRWMFTFRSTGIYSRSISVSFCGPCVSKNGNTPTQTHMHAHTHAHTHTHTAGLCGIRFTDTFCCLHKCQRLPVLKVSSVVLNRETLKHGTNSMASLSF